MSLPVNNKKGGKNKNQKPQNQNSKFIKGAASTKPAGAAKAVRSTGANRGS